MRRSLRLALALLAVTGLTAFSAAPARQERVTPPGEGVICAWALTNYIAEVGERCTNSLSAEIRVELRSSADRLDAYMLANTNLTPEDLARLKQEQVGAGMPVAEFCNADARGFLEQAPRITVAEIRQQTDAIVAHPGTPTWGTCV